MTTEVTKTVSKLPANLAALFAGKNNIARAETINQITFKGKVWTIHVDGAATKLVDEDGLPLQMIEVVVLNANPRRSRVYYEGSFDGEGKAPVCYSYDGKKPALSVETPQCDSCDKCPMSVRGSKVTDKGVEVAACATRQRIVVIPADKPEFPALLINMSTTSAYDKDGKDSAKGWFAFDQYKADLGKNGVPHTAAVRTKIKFAADDAYPRLQFRFGGYVGEGAEIIAERTDTDEVYNLLNADHGKTGGETKPVAIAAPKAKPALTVIEDDEVASPPPPKPKAKPAPVVVQEDEDEDEVAPPPPPKPKAKPAPVVVEDNESMTAALAIWED